MFAIISLDPTEAEVLLYLNNGMDKAVDRADYSEAWAWVHKLYFSFVLVLFSTLLVWEFFSLSSWSVWDTLYVHIFFLEFWFLFQYFLSIFFAFIIFFFVLVFSYFCSLSVIFVSCCTFVCDTWYSLLWLQSKLPIFYLLFKLFYTMLSTQYCMSLFLLLFWVKTYQFLHR